MDNLIKFSSSHIPQHDLRYSLFWFLWASLKRFNPVLAQRTVGEHGFLIPGSYYGIKLLS